MKIRVSPKEGFTLIELLVVISIIAILAGIALPAFTQVIERGNQTKALSNAKQIYVGLKLFSGDNDGAFPNKTFAENTSYARAAAGVPANSNAAFRWIVPEYIKSENIFYLAKSGWTPSAPDENTTGAEALSAGENHWAFVVNLTETSNPNLPLIADGFTTGGNLTGTYTTNEILPGGVWKGKAAIIVRVDGSGRVERTVLAGENATVQGPVGGTEDQNIFTLQPNWLVTGQNAVNPLAP